MKLDIVENSLLFKSIIALHLRQILLSDITFIDELHPEWICLGDFMEQDDDESTEALMAGKIFA